MTSETKWTHGPWQVAMARRRGITMYGVRQHTHAMVTMDASDYWQDGVRQDADGYWMPTFDDVATGRLDCSEPHLANAHLIAAAPDLYEALVVMLDVAARLESADVYSSPFAYIKARAALAKARGETNND